LTRAKSSLCILETEDYFRGVHADGLEYRIDRNDYGEPDKLSVNLTHRDVYLGYFEYCQQTVRQMFDGDTLVPAADGCSNAQGKGALRFSKGFLARKAQFESLGYTLTEAKVNFMLWWYNKESSRHTLILLPSLTFRK